MLRVEHEAIFMTLMHNDTSNLGEFKLEDSCLLWTD